MIDENLKSKSIQISEDVLERLRSRENIISFVDSKNDNQEIHWGSTYLGSGDLSLAFAFGAATEILQTNVYQQTIRNYAKQVAQNLESSYRGQIGLFQGLSGVNFTFNFLGRVEPRFLKSLSNIESELCNVSNSYCDHLLLSDSIQSNVYDVISGIAGVGAYFLSNYEQSSQNRQTLQKIIDTLIYRINHLSPLCFATKSNSLTLEYTQKYPERANGYVDLGLAHGLCGPLGFLSLAGMQGLVDEDGNQAIFKLYEQIFSGVMYQQQIPVMPSFVGLDFKSLAPEEHIRPAWCYGNLGCARAILLAGIYLKNPQIIDFAFELLVPVAKKALVPKNNPFSMLCHGKAGAVQIFLKCIQDLENLGFDNTRLDLLKRALNFLIAEIIDDFDEQNEFGFPQDCFGETTIPEPGYLMGSSGIAVALLSVALNSNVPWDRSLLVT